MVYIYILIHTHTHMCVCVYATRPHMYIPLAHTHTHTRLGHIDCSITIYNSASQSAHRIKCADSKFGRCIYIHVYICTHTHL